MKNIKLTVEYDGTGYHGWQSQINAVTVQDTISNAILKLTGENCNLIGSSRTDAGVHALGLVANFMTDSNIPGDKFSYALNNFLPTDVVVRASEEVNRDFHARFDAKGKKYKYLIYNAPHASAILRNYSLHVRCPLDIGGMQQALKYFIGTHDFSAFKCMGSEVSSNVRTINHVSIERKNEIIEFQIAGNGFLYNMVRIITGTLIEIGQGKRKPQDIPVIINSQDRTMAGKTAAPQGLYLVEVYY